VSGPVNEYTSIMTDARKYTWGEAFIPGTKRYLREVRRKVVAGKAPELAQVALRIQWSLNDDDLVIVPVLVRAVLWDLYCAAIETGGQVRLGPYRRRLAALVSGVNPLATQILDPREFAMVDPAEYEAFMRYGRTRFEIPATGA
jgi:hypothetical protein